MNKKDIAKDRADWLVDAVATATQNEMFLRGEEQCDKVACDAIQMCGEKAIRVATKSMQEEIDRLREQLSQAMKALAPFAKEADKFGDGWANERRAVSVTWSPDLTIGDFRRARTVHSMESEKR